MALFVENNRASPFAFYNQHYSQTEICSGIGSVSKKIQKRINSCDLTYTYTIMVQRKYEDYTKIVQKSKTHDQAHCYYSSSYWRNGLAY